MPLTPWLYSRIGQPKADGCCRVHPGQIGLAYSAQVIAEKKPEPRIQSQRLMAYRKNFIVGNLFGIACVGADHNGKRAQQESSLSWSFTSVPAQPLERIRLNKAATSDEHKLSLL